jgi:hypothetical protein
MNLKATIYSCLISIIVLSAKTHADVVTFTLDTIPDDVASFSITESGLTMLMMNPVSETGFIDADDPGGSRGFTFDFFQTGSDDMSAVDVSFDAKVKVIGYSVSVATTGYASGFYTVAFKNVSGLDTSVGDYNLQTPIPLFSGQAMTIEESTLRDFGAGYFIMSSITVDVVPEPSTFFFLAAGGIAFAFRRKRN